MRVVFCSVGLVREHYGFDDEDPAEIARIKFLKKELTKRKYKQSSVALTLIIVFER
jgi:hypothetical protein